MKILLDANISWKLLNKLEPIYGECAHVDYIGFKVPVMDIDIWNYALEHEYIIITKDTDFVEFIETKGFPPKVVLIKSGNNKSQELLELLTNAKPLIEDFENKDFGLLELLK